MEEIKLEVPVEPPHLSVVLDREDFAWQRIGPLWLRGGAVMGFFDNHSGPREEWMNLLASRGPVRVLHWAPVVEKAASR